MKNYYLIILTYTSYFTRIVQADRVAILDGCYKFMDNESEAIAYYPIEKTVIEKIENVKQ